MKSIESTPLNELPPDLKRELEEFAERLQSQLAEDLVSLLVFGGAARGEYHVGRSDVDLVLVLRAAPAKLLLELGNVLQVARFQSRFEAMILTEEEVQRAADAFPIFYSDIRSCHVLLAGRDAFADLVISEQHLRLRVEQELRECQIRLRRVVADSLGEAHALSGAVIRKVKQMRSPLRTLARLEGRSVPDKLPEVLADAGARFELDTTVLLEPDRAPLVAVGVLMELLSRSIARVDQMPGN